MSYIKLFVVVIFVIVTACHSTVEEFFSREKCYEDLGCFYAGKPFFDIVERPVSLLPDDREVINTKLIQFSAQGHSSYSNLNQSIDDLVEKGFNPSLTTRFIVPGFMSKIATYWKMPMVESLLRYEPSNVFMVDWQGGDGPLYEQAVANTRVVGAELALFIKRIQKKFGLNLESVHLIGHSLGAHIAGYAGKRLDKVGRITALDPAGPYFTEVDPIVRLDRNDARFVDAIHTNAAPSRFQGFGLTNSIAHLDFWPNGGHLQPGCPDMGSSIWSFITHPTFDYDGLHDIMCNHDKSIDLFISTLNHPDCEMFGVVCDKWETYLEGRCNSRDSRSYLMGINADQNIKYINKSKILNLKSLDLYLSTTDSAPFCMK